ncbi:MAG TPA: gliding motility-associated C-terminal domain-containing protein [Sphingobacteriaceae bacterium]
MSVIKKGFILVFNLLFFGFSFITIAQEYEQTTWLGFTDQLGTQIHDIDNHGNAYVSMSHSYNKWSSFLFPNGEADGPKVFAKLSPEGKLLWSLPFNHTIYQVKADEQENVYVSGVGRVTLSTGEVLPSGSFVIKFNKTGRSLWGVVNEASHSSLTSGPIALANDGIFWNASFYNVTNLQGRKLTAAVPGSPDSFVAKINSLGTITALYHDNHSSVIQEMVEAENGNAAFLITRGGIPKFKVVLNEKCQIVSDKPFILYGDFPPRVNKTANGYEMLSRIGTHTASGYTERGFYHIRFDRNLDLIDSVKIFNAYDPMFHSNGVPLILESAGSTATGFFIETIPKPFLISHRKEWLYMDTDYNLTVIPNENAAYTIGDDPFSRYYVKMVGDTLHMLVRRFTYPYGNTFTFNKQVYTTEKNNDFSWFWAKYVFKGPQTCDYIRVSTVQSGKEGSRAAKLRFTLSASCLATEDITITISSQNIRDKDDIDIPPSVTIKKGESFVDLELQVTDDNVIEEAENFSVDFSTAKGSAYKLSKATERVLIEDDDERQLVVYFPPQVTEGASDVISVSIPDGKMFPTDILLLLKLKSSAFTADTLLDFAYPSLMLPAYTNRVEMSLTASNDDLLEGDEFIEGDLTANAPGSGTLSQLRQTVKIIVIDPDNTYENRLFNITPGLDTIREGNSQTYYIKLKDPLTLQRPIAIEAQPSQPIPLFIQHTPAAFRYNTAGNYLTVLHTENFSPNPKKSIIFNWNATDPHTGSYRFSWRNDDSGKMEIFLPDKDFHFTEVPNTFSPNGDGINDTWTIKSLQGIRCFVWIYNRYGILLYQSENYSQPWDGKCNGTNLPEGSYYYKISVADKQFGGNINIIR